MSPLPVLACAATPTERDSRPLHCRTMYMERIPLERLKLIHSNFPSLPCAQRKTSDVERILPSDNAPLYDPRAPLGDMLLMGEDQGDGTCLIPVQYKESDMRQQLGKPGGRLFAEKGRSLQSLCKYIRHTLCHDIYHDIDIKNAHPTILLQQMEQWGDGAHFVELRRVVAHRDQIMREAEGKGYSHEDMKQRIIILMYGGDLPAKTSRDFPWLVSLQHEFSKAADIISNRPEHQFLLDAIQATPKKGRGRVAARELESTSKFRLVSCVLQEIENAILQSCIQFLDVDQGLSVGELVLCFDGFMVPKSQLGIVEPAFLDSLSSWVENKTGWAVNFAVKPMNMIMDLSGLAPTFVKGQTVHSDVHAGEIIRVQLAGGELAFRAEGQTYVKLPDSNTWVVGDKNLVDVLKQYCHKADFVDIKGKKYSHNAVGIKNITTAFCVPEDPLFPSRLEKASIRKIFWSDGVYDFRTGTFRPEGPDDMTAARVPRPYPKDVPSTEILEKYKKMLFTDPLGEEVGTFYLKCMARAAAGHIEDKRWFVFYGLRDAGKGVVEIALRSALGPQYVVSYNIKALELKNCSTSDAEYELKWVVLVRWARIAISNETIEKKLDSNLSKKLVSGGDPVLLRIPHGMPYTVVPQCTFVDNANDLFEASTADAMETCIMVQSNVKFVKSGDYKAVNDLERPSHWRLADPDLKGKLKTPELGDIVWHLLLSHYSSEVPQIPECIKTEAATMMNEDYDDIDNVIAKRFSITGKASDYVTSKQMAEVMAVLGQEKKMVKLRHKLRLSNNPATGMIVKDATIRINGIKTRVWTGIKLNADESIELGSAVEL